MRMPWTKLPIVPINGPGERVISLTVHEISQDGGKTVRYMMSVRDHAELMRIVDRIRPPAATSKRSARPSATGTKNTGLSRPSRKSGSRQKKNRGTDG